MFVRILSMQDWADVHDELEVTDRQIAGPVLVTTGEHPQLGAVVAIQADNGMHVLTERVPILRAPEATPRKKKRAGSGPKRMAWLDLLKPERNR